MPGVTVVVPTCRRPRSLARLLDALAPQTQGVEVVVVDDDPGGGAAAAAAGRPVRYVTAGGLGASGARNAGAAVATGSVLAFIDDDVVPAAGWLNALAAPIVAGDADMTGGEVVLDPAAHRPRWFDDDTLGLYLSRFWLGPSPRPLERGEFVITANAAVRATVFHDVGGFDTRLGPTAGGHLVNDDVALCRAIAARGGRLQWVPAAVVVHDLPAERLRARWLLRRAWDQGRSDWISDTTGLADGRFGGASQAMQWWRHEVRARIGEGLHRPPVLLHAACDASRTMGALVESGRSVGRRHRRAASNTSIKRS